MKINIHEWEETKEIRLVNLGDKVNILDGHCSMKFLKLKSNYINGKEFIKSIFGKQLTCKQYSHRAWIWTVGNDTDTAIIYIIWSVRGITFSYNANSNIDDVVQLYKDIMNKIYNS